MRYYTVQIQSTLSFLRVAACSAAEAEARAEERLRRADYDVASLIAGRSMGDATIQVVEDATIQAVDSEEVRVKSINVIEDNAGGIHLFPSEHGLLIEVDPAGDALTDCRLYGSGWSPDPLLEDNVLWLDDPGAPEIYGSGYRWVAVYTVQRGLELTVDPRQMCESTRTYLGVTEEDENDGTA